MSISDPPSLPRKPASKWRLKRGLIRLWILFAVAWIAVVGGIGVVEWWEDLAQLKYSFVKSFNPDPSKADYEALCAKLRKQAAESWRGWGGMTIKWDRNHALAV
jgi:hypothetical protein